MWSDNEMTCNGAVWSLQPCKSLYEHIYVNKGLGMSSRVCATGHIKDPVPLIEKSRASCPSARFPPSFIHQVIVITGLYNLSYTTVCCRPEDGLRWRQGVKPPLKLITHLDTLGDKKNTLFKWRQRLQDDQAFALLLLPATIDIPRASEMMTTVHTSTSGELVHLNYSPPALIK